MVNSPRAGSLVEPESARGVCAIAGEENSPVAPNAAAPPMKPRLQISHIAPPGSIGTSPTAIGGLHYCDWVCPLAAFLHELAAVTSGLRIAKPALVLAARVQEEGSCHKSPVVIRHVL